MNMDTFLTIAIDLIKTTCVIVTFAYVLTRTTFFTDVLDKKFNIKNQVVLIVLFGILSIFGTYGGLKLPSGAIANIRDLGPLAAGLVAGPIVGFGAGLIGGVHRYLLGGFVGLPCSLATVLAGLLGGMIYKLNKGKCVTVWQAVLLVFLMESLHVGLVLWLARPYDIALSVSQELILPMMGANALGMTIFIFRVRNLISERETAAEKEKLQRERMRLEYEMEMAEFTATN
jgi:sigma-B regulation protein RsbU (phosphoserine phosphatase)